LRHGAWKKGVAAKAELTGYAAHQEPGEERESSVEVMEWKRPRMSGMVEVFGTGDGVAKPGWWMAWIGDGQMAADGETASFFVWFAAGGAHHLRHIFNVAAGGRTHALPPSPPKSA
jgi:hypothetical protein